jgi:ribosome-associated protein
MSPEELKDFIIKLLDEKKAENINVIDLQNTTSLTRFMIFANGRSSRNIIAMANHVADELKNTGHKHTSIEGLGQAEWVLMDAGDVIVHLFQAEARAHYKLEDLWSERKH